MLPQQHKILISVSLQDQDEVSYNLKRKEREKERERRRENELKQRAITLPNLQRSSDPTPKEDSEGSKAIEEIGM